MIKPCTLAVALGALAFAAAPTTAPETAMIPGSTAEHLTYSVNWPSGLSLGEMTISASRISGDTGKAGRLAFDGALDASLPGFTIGDHYQSEASGDFCTAHFEKHIRHGARASEETSTFDPAGNRLTRETKGGGRREQASPACPMDALTFLYFVRNELAHGRLPQPQVVFFGAAYNVRLEFGGAEKVKVAGTDTEADRINATVHGPASDFTVQIYFAHDAARTPVLVRVPVSVGTLSAELTK
jgi:hypothetical protein